MKTKFFALVLTFALIATLFIGCTKKEELPSEDPVALGESNVSAHVAEEPDSIDAATDYFQEIYFLRNLALLDSWKKTEDIPIADIIQWYLLNQKNGDVEALKENINPQTSRYEIPQAELEEAALKTFGITAERLRGNEIYFAAGKNDETGTYFISANELKEAIFEVIPEKMEEDDDIKKLYVTIKTELEEIPVVVTIKVTASETVFISFEILK